MKHQGGCHCGRIRFAVEADVTGLVACNCSYCRPRGSLLFFVTQDAFDLQTPEEGAATYRFNKHVIDHHFCPHCGISPFSRGKRPSDGAAMVAINARCLPDLDLTGIPVRHVDGRSL